MAESYLPECKPLKSLTDVFRWTPLGNGSDTVSRFPLSKATADRVGYQTLICHDMKGGYQEDRFPQGCENHKAYRFYHWSLVDTFVYFSHEFCTIPPTTWIDAAHKQDVRVLGTIITEWDAGKRICKEFLAADNRKVLVAKLVEISKFYGFEGWLINIENEISVSQMSSMKSFVEELTKEMHKQISGSLVLWYDSIIEDGTLCWQNELNHKNRSFFDLCDGIFLNYCWNDEKLKNSKEIAATNDRVSDVYVGVDVFGRGCPGGGGFNTKQAMEMIRHHDLSAAMFAQGWTHEYLGETDFTENENRFWRELIPYCTRRPHCCIPLVTSFCQGYGLKYYQHGKIVDTKPWFNLSLQQVQPSREGAVSRKSATHPRLQGCVAGTLLTGPSEQPSSFDVIGSQTIKVKVHDGNAYQGGSCLLIELLKETNQEFVQLLDMDVVLKENLLMSCTYLMKSGPPCFKGLRLTVRKNGEVKHILLSITETKSENDAGFNSQQDSRTGFELSSLDKNTAMKHFGILPECDSSWETCYFLVDSSSILDWTLSLVELVIEGSENSSFLLGQIQIIPEKSSSLTHPKVTKLQFVELGHNLSSTTLRIWWDLANDGNVQYYNIFTCVASHDPHTPELIGHTTRDEYILTHLKGSKLTVFVQPVSIIGATLPISDCAFIEIPDK